MGKASELKAAWQLALFILPLVVLLVIALPTRGISHDVEGKIILLAVIFIAVILKSERDKRKTPSLATFFNHLQSILISVICMIIFFGLVFLFDALLIKWLGRNNSYGYLPYGFLIALASYLVVRKNPESVRYAPFIMYLPMFVSALVGDFDPMNLPGMLLTALFCALAYIQGKRRGPLSHGR